MPCAPNWSPERVRTRGDLLDSQADKSDPYTPSHGPYPRTVRGTGGPCPYASPAAKSRNFLPRARRTGGHGYGTTFSTYGQALREACGRSGIRPSKLGKKSIQWDTSAGLGLLSVLYQGFQADSRLKDVSFEAGSSVKMSSKAAANRERQKQEWARGVTAKLAGDFRQSAAYVTIRPWIYAMKDRVDAEVEKDTNDSIDEEGRYTFKESPAAPTS